MAIKTGLYLDFANGRILELSSGDVVDPASLGTGTPDNTKYLRGDSTWQVPPGGGSGDMVLASAQTNSGIKTFLDTTMKLRNVANTFDGYFVNTNTANRIYTLKDADGTLAFVSDITGTNSGTNTGDQTSIVGITGTKAQFDTAVTDGNIVYVGDVVGVTDGDKGDIAVTGTGTIWTIDNDVVTNAKLADVATQTLKGRKSAGTGDPSDLDMASVTNMLMVFTDLLQGLVPASGGGTTTFLRADGTFATPAGGSGISLGLAISTAHGMNGY